MKIKISKDKLKEAFPFCIWGIHDELEPFLEDENSIKVDLVETNPKENPNLEDEIIFIGNHKVKIEGDDRFFSEVRGLIEEYECLCDKMRVRYVVEWVRKYDSLKERIHDVVVEVPDRFLKKEFRDEQGKYTKAD